MKCPKCGIENKNNAKFCNDCGAPLSSSSAKGAKIAPAAPPRDFAGRSDLSTDNFWKPDWRWHAKALLVIYVSLTVIYFVLSLVLSKVPEPYRMRDIPKEMTPWLKQ
ncbi:MAG TPA: zinc ribbon domain-containing protein [Elusimicrobiota bacterium]|nr:zinc ribbon domain-containing protein [Elusimicrobiota bacterium]